MDYPSHTGHYAPLLMVAAEASGDQHGAALVRALHERFPYLQVYGLGGDHMRAAGVDILFDVQALNVVGVVEILAKVPAGLRMAHRLLRAAACRGTRVVVLIDAPGFEVPFYTAAGVDAEYVGHPLLDRVHHLPAPAQAAQTVGLDARYPIMALLPGSRRQELRRLLPPMLAAFQRVQRRLPSLQGIIPVACRCCARSLRYGHAGGGSDRDSHGGGV